LSDLHERIDDMRKNAVHIRVQDVDHEELPLLDGEEAVAVCPECEALVWIADPADDGELYLMRICEVETDDCVTCTRARAAVHDPELEDVIRGVLEDE